MSLNSATVTVVNPLEQPVAPKKRGWLPLLTVLFLISYGIMTMLIIEQGATIESQRALIRELFRDSTELTTLKMQAKDAGATTAKGQSQAPGVKAPSTQNSVTPSTQSPSTQAPSKQSPSSQAVPAQRAQKQTQKPQFQMPSKPASDLADQERSLITI